MKVRGYITHKAAENYSDCADYFRICPQTKRVAVSDGVGQSIMPLEWAKILVNSFIEERWLPGDDITPLQRAWLSEAQAYLRAQKESGHNPWMLENCLLNRDGAGATFCGVSFPKKNKWSAIILGDSCLVEINNKEKIEAIHSSKVGAFNNRPDYFDSMGPMSGTIAYREGELDRKKAILLVSDPFSELFQKIKGTPDEKVIIKEIFELSDDQSEFEKLVDRYRENYGMHNDDSTLLIIESEFGDGGINIVFQKTLEESQKDEAERSRKAEEEKKHRIDADKALWDKYDAIGTIDAYQEYLQLSKDKIYGPHAERKIKELQSKEKSATDEQDWLAAQTTDTQDAFLHYIDLHSDGKYVNIAYQRIKVLTSKIPGTPSSQEEELPETSEDPVCCKSSVTQQTQSASSTVESVPEEASGAIEAATLGEPVAIQGFDEQPGGIHSEEVVTVIDNSQSLAVPEDVDASDGIDRLEFSRIGDTAEKLFERYHLKLQNALNKNKWDDDRKRAISDCFKEFWSELENIIYSK